MMGMKHATISLSLALAVGVAFADPVVCSSPNGRGVVTFDVTAAGEPTYSFAVGGRKVVEPSTLGFDILALGKDAFKGRIPGELRTGFSVAGAV